MRIAGKLSEVRTDSVYCYYPGCTLSTTATEINQALNQVCAALGIGLVELPDWNCCGSSSVHAVRPQLAVSLAARNLFQAEDTGLDLMVMCAGCLNRLRSAHHQLLGDPTTRRVNREIFGRELKAGQRVVHFLDVITPLFRSKEVRKLLVRPLQGLRFVAYYGCLLARPPELHTHPLLHDTMETVLEQCGAESLLWGYQAKCCGSFLSVARPDLVVPMVSDIMNQAVGKGADCIVTACAMCQINLELRSKGAKTLPVFSIVELLALALGSDDYPAWMKRHLIDPRPLLALKGLGNLLDSPRSR